eukprot:CAMPEP_0182869876 /NCGR_PEP_ID=MMETSP0034_2-20130328/10189_1 /TAXON_ID=156128 /ORGANISM="Nephroselmis pyriformis, Strain CCMP717" /LENGTH=304 /DNA_ID=CAMNT_0025002357 /DNA_START=79 /DNA_END=990 /DNA_ORIENTATION=-
MASTAAASGPSGHPTCRPATSPARLLASRGSSWLSPRPIKPSSVRMMAPKNDRMMAVCASVGDVTLLRGGQLGEAASLLVEGLYLDGRNELDAGQLRGLSRAQQKDLQARFSGRGGLEGCVLGLRDDATGAVAAAAAVGVVPFRGKDALLSLDDLSPAVARAEGVVLRPVVSNLVVSPAQRRRGLGKVLMAACEEEAAEWGYDEAWLLVESGNRKARSLYGKLGYRAVRTAKMDAVKVIKGRVEEGVPVSNVYMRKSLRGGLAGAILNTDWFRIGAAGTAAAAAYYYRADVLEAAAAAAAAVGE